MPEIRRLCYDKEVMRYSSCSRAESEGEAMKFAFLVMGDYDSACDRAAIRRGSTQLIGVSSIEEACAIARELVAEGVDCIELCGAFGEEGAREVIAASGGALPVGYVVHLPEQDELFRELFGE